MRPNHALSNSNGMHALSVRVRGYNFDRCLNLRHFFDCMCSVVSGKTAWRHQLVSAFPVCVWAQIAVKTKGQTRLTLSRPETPKRVLLQTYTMRPR